MTSDPPGSRDRPTIEQRAEVRERMEKSGRDRYSSLVRQLQAGRDVTPGRVRRDGFNVHPVFWFMLRLALILVAVYIIGIFLLDRYREGLVETWQGPAVVQSGQVLPGCAATQGLRHDVVPVWIRYEGDVYTLTRAAWPLGLQTGVGETSLVETGYSLGTLRLLVTEEPPGGAAPPQLILARPPAAVGSVYQAEPDCN